MQSVSQNSGHGGIRHYGTAAGVLVQQSTDAYATVPLACPWCDSISQAAVLAATTDVNGTPLTRWVRCIGCGLGAFIDDNGDIHPGRIAGEEVDNVPTPIGGLYLEARKALGHGAPTGCEMLCRSVLGGIARDLGWTKRGSFVEAIDFVIEEGYVTKAMRPWVDRIRQHGNEVVHEAVLIDSERALDTLGFTAQLLKLVYQMPALGLKHEPPTVAP
jgi:Domain of unknown function (DUF4145)